VEAAARICRKRRAESTLPTSRLKLIGASSTLSVQ
jgi:hypothetical protein